MSHIIIYPKKELLQKINCRAGEEKFAQKIYTFETTDNWDRQLKKHPTKYVIIGIPEDIGVRANLGRPGTATAWDNFLDNFLNLQHNAFCKASRITLFGALDFSEEMHEAALLDGEVKEERRKMFKLVAQIDKVVTDTIETIVSQGKIPIIVGGGHNNAYGNLKGFSKACSQPINAVNYDAHTDLRPMKGRHSGNGFSYAMKENYLQKYFIFGLHENYLSRGVMKEMHASSDRIQYNTYEEIAVREEKQFELEMNKALLHVAERPFGLEIDLDSISMIASSAMTPGGFSIEQTRQFIHHFASHKNVGYLHLCEGAPTLASSKNPNLIGKFISYLITDFIKAHTKGKI